MAWVPVLTRCAEEGALSLSLGHPLLDDYLAFVGVVSARARQFSLRPSLTSDRLLRATPSAFDGK